MSPGPWGAAGFYRRRAAVVATQTGLVLDKDAGGDVGLSSSGGDQDHTFCRSPSDLDASIEPGVIAGGLIQKDADGDLVVETFPNVP